MKGYKNTTKTVYDPVKDEPTSRPLTADQMRNVRSRMKAAPPKTVGEGYSRLVAARSAATKAADAKRGYDPVKDEPTSRPFAKGGYVKGGAVKGDKAQDKATVRKAVHKHERVMHPGKPLTKMRNGGMVGC
ncbi:MAG: hypothetical protein RI988_3438 [Pseudomonadota bacterium]|jgi:hypothetical protein